MPPNEMNPYEPEVIQARETVERKPSGAISGLTGRLMNQSGNT